MPTKKKEFSKEKVTLSDGRYLIYYNFELVIKGHNITNGKSGLINEVKEEKHV